ncbi:hypothetical protein NMY22_g5309 [Coprinellus aureogranulatus]|nr:hypothetical protein NMY22_g5309 [Coprinellus aureogranulatus]
MKKRVEKSVTVYSFIEPDSAVPEVAEFQDVATYPKFNITKDCLVACGFPLDLKGIIKVFNTASGLWSRMVSLPFTVTVAVGGSVFLLGPATKSTDSVSTFVKTTLTQAKTPAPSNMRENLKGNCAALKAKLDVLEVRGFLSSQPAGALSSSAVEEDVMESKRDLKNRKRRERRARDKEKAKTELKKSYEISFTLTPPFEPSSHPSPPPFPFDDEDDKRLSQPVLSLFTSLLSSSCASSMSCHSLTDDEDNNSTDDVGNTTVVPSNTPPRPTQKHPLISTPQAPSMSQFVDLSHLSASPGPVRKKAKALARKKKHVKTLEEKRWPADFHIKDVVDAFTVVKGRSTSDCNALFLQKTSKPYKETTVNNAHEHWLNASSDVHNQYLSAPTIDRQPLWKDVRHARKMYKREVANAVFKKVREAHIAQGPSSTPSEELEGAWDEGYDSHAEKGSTDDEDDNDNDSYDSED